MAEAKSTRPAGHSDKLRGASGFLKAIANEEKSERKKMRKNNSKKTDVRTEAKNQAEYYLDLARAMWPQDESLARRYVHIARQLAMRHRVHLDPRTYCKACGVPFIAATLKVRQERANQTVLYACRKCNTQRRIPYTRKTERSAQAGLDRQPGPTKIRRLKKRKE